MEVLSSHKESRLGMGKMESLSIVILSRSQKGIGFATGAYFAHDHGGNVINLKREQIRAYNNSLRYPQR